jgi:hypothetical protein
MVLDMASSVDGYRDLVSDGGRPRRERVDPMAPEGGIYHQAPEVVRLEPALAAAADGR